jgi:hypothetical protein
VDIFAARGLRQPRRAGVPGAACECHDLFLMIRLMRLRRFAFIGMKSCSVG